MLLRFKIFLLKIIFKNRNNFDRVIVKILSNYIFTGKITKSKRNKYEEKLYAMMNNFKTTKDPDEFNTLCNILEDQLYKGAVIHNKRVEQLGKELFKLREFIKGPPPSNLIR